MISLADTFVNMFGAFHSIVHGEAKIRGVAPRDDLLVYFFVRVFDRVECYNFRFLFIDFQLVVPRPF